MNVKIDVLGQIDAEKTLKLLGLPANKRRQFLGGLGREIRRQSIRNLRAMKGVDGKSWAPRKRGDNRKLLRHLNRQINQNIVSDFSVEVGFRGAVAMQQHDGYTKVMNAKKMGDEQKARDSQELMATRKQAKTLRDHGYKIRVNKKWVMPSLTWITENIKQKQAGLILRILKDQPLKKSWITTVPARPFLGVTEKQFQSFVGKIFDNTMARV